MAGELLALERGRLEGETLIIPVMQAGRRLAPSPPLAEVRRRAAGERSRLSGPLRRLDDAPSYPVTTSEALLRLAEEVDRRVDGH